MAVRSSLSSEIKVPSIGAFQYSDCSFKNLTAVVNFSSRRAASAVKPLRAAAESRRNDSVSPLAATAIAAPKTEEDVKEEVRIVEEEDFQQLAKELENASPLEIMDKALAKFGNDIAIAFRDWALECSILKLGVEKHLIGKL